MIFTRKIVRRRWIGILIAGLILLTAGFASVAATPASGVAPFSINLGVGGVQQPQDVDGAIKILFGITL